MFPSFPQSGRQNSFYAPAPRSSTDRALDYPRAYAAALSTTFLYYPVRDLVRAGGRLHGTNPVDFALSRYRGLATHPEMPLLIAAPLALLYWVFVSLRRTVGGYWVPGALAGAAHGAARLALRHFAQRVGQRKNFHGDFKHRSNWAAVIATTRDHGVLSWFHGLGPTAVVHGLLYASVLRGVCARTPADSSASSFFEDAFTAFRVHAMWSLIWSPLRVPAARVLHAHGSPHVGRDSAGTWLRNEAQLLLQVPRSLRHIVSSEGVFALLHGYMPIVGKTSLPFGLTFATFRVLGGSLHY